MLALKTGHQLTWGDLQFIEVPMVAKQTLKSNHGVKVGGESIINAKDHNLPDERSRSFDPYSDIDFKLDNGNVFLVNSNTANPVFTRLEITEHNTAKWEITHSQTAMFENSIDATMRHIPVPKVHGVLRQEVSEQSSQVEEAKIEREKHVILLNLEGQNDRPLPLKHNITLYVENTTKGSTAVRQLNEVIYSPFSRVFSTEKGDQLKVYAIPDSLLEVKKDLNDNKNLANSESQGLIAALEETGQETRDDGAIIHHMKYIVPIPLSLTVGYEYGEKLDRHSVLTLQDEDSDWAQVIYLGIGPKERRVEKADDGWLHVRFEDLPESGTFSLILHNTQDGSSDVPFFSSKKIDELSNLFEFEELEVAVAEEFEEIELDITIAADEQEKWLKSIAT